MILSAWAVVLWAAPPLAARQENRQLIQEKGLPNANAPRRIALVIGNGSYQNATPLRNPPNDATLMAATLRKLGFEVTVGTDASQREMRRLIREFGQRLHGGGGIGLFYYAGHGVQARGRNYLIPVDAQIQTEADLDDVAIDVNYVLGVMDDAQDRLNIAILDACRNNPFASSFRSAQGGLAQVRAPSGTLIAYATAPDSVASDGAGANGPYAEALARQMQVSDLVLETMFRRVTEQVSSRTGGRQEPWVSDNHKGEFYFTESAAAAGTTGGDPPGAKIDAAAVEREYWETIRQSTDARDFQDYLRLYPAGAFAGIARIKLRQLETAKNSAPAGAQTADQSSLANGGPKTGSASLAPTFKNQQGIDFVLISPGEFMMGSAYGQGNEVPVHHVTISTGFYLGRYEITRGQWQAVMGHDPSGTKACDTCPVNGVTWDEAQLFLEQLNRRNDGFLYRLPSEAEWEYACRASTIGDFAGDLDSMAWYYRNSGPGSPLHPVGTKKPNGWGLYDMHGNALEWCQDFYQGDYTGAPTDGSVWNAGAGGRYRVLRGGASNMDPNDLRSSSRRYDLPSNLGFGLRVVAVPRPPVKGR